MAIISPYATPTSFTMQADGRTQTAYSGEISGAPSDTEITAIDVSGKAIGEPLYCRINMGADWASMGATGGFIVYFNALKMFQTNQTIAISGGIDPRITLLIPAGVDFKVTTINDGSAGNISRWVVCTAWSLQRKPYRVI